MKKTSKLFAFIIAFSMIASTIVFPVVTDATELTDLAAGGDFEAYEEETANVTIDGENNISEEFGEASLYALASGQDVPQPLPNLIPANSGLLYYTGNGAVPYDETEGAYEVAANANVRHINVPVTKGETYVLEASIRYKEQGITGGSISSTLEPGGMAAATEALSTTSTCVFGDTYKTWRTKFTVPLNAPRTAIHAGYQLNLNGAAYIKMALKKYVPEMSVTVEGIENGATGVDIDKELTFTFRNKPYEFEEDVNLVLTSEGQTVTGKMEITPVSDTEYSVSLTGLDVGTAYNLSLVNVMDMYAQPAELSLNFTTTIIFNILRKNGYDHSFENSVVPDTDGTDTPQIVTEGGTMPAAHDGSKYVKVTGIEGEGGIRFNNIGVGEEAQLKVGRTYEVSYYARTPFGEGLSETTGTASVLLSTDDNSVYLGNLEQPEVEIKSGGWTKVTGRATIYSTDENLEYAGINIGTKVSGISEAYFDFFEVIEVVPEFKITTVPGNGATDVRTAVMNIVFSNAPEAFDESFITISPGSVVSCVKLSDTEYKVTFENTVYGQKHIVSLDRVTDPYGQFIDGYTTEFTMGVAPAMPDTSNIIPANNGLLYYTGNGAVPYDETEGAYEVTGDANVRHINVPVTKGQAYVIEASIRYKEEGITGGSISATLEPGGMAADEEALSTTSNCVFDNTYKTWRTAFIVPEDAPRTAIHAGYRLSLKGDAYIKIAIRKYVPEMKVTTTPASGITELETDTEILVEFSNAPYVFDESVFAVKKVEGNVPFTSGVSYEKLSDKEYKIILKDLDIKTKYALEFINLKDVYGQILAADPVEFTTTMASNIIEENSFDFSFENGQTAFLQKSGAQTFEVKNASDVHTYATHGEKILKISDRDANAMALIKGIGSGTENAVEAGRRYLVSFDIRTADTENGIGTTDMADIYVAAVPGSKVVPANPKNTAATPIDRNWKNFSYIVDMVEAEGAQNGGIDIGVKVAGTTSVYIDKLVFKEYIPEINTITDPEDGEMAANSESVTYTFTTAPIEFTTGNVSITGGDQLTPAVSEVKQISDTVYKVSFSNIEISTEYTVSVTGIVDEYGRDLSKEITFTTFSGNTEADNNLLTGSNNGFEFSPLGLYTSHSGNVYGDGAIEGGVNAKEVCTVVGEDNGVTPYEGSQMLKIVSYGDATPTSHRMNFIRNGIEQGKRYQVSYYARTVNPSDVTTASVMLSHTGSTQLKSTAPSVKVDNQWTKVYAEIEIVYYEGHGFHMGVNISGVDVYIDNYQVIEIPAEELHITSSTPATGETDVDINVGKVVLNYSEAFSNNLDVDNVIKVFKGNEDVTTEVVTDVDMAFGNAGIIVTLNQLDNGTIYKVVATDVMDYLGRKVTGEIAFKTMSAISTTGSTIRDETGELLDIETIDYNDYDKVKSATINVTNASPDPIARPLYIYTIYNADGTLHKTGTTSFAPGVGLVANDSIPLSHTFDASDLQNRILTLYLVNSYKSLQLAAEPVELDFIIPQP